MSQTAPSENRCAVSTPEAKRLLDDFDQAWRRGLSPQIEAYFPPGQAPGDPVRRKLLEELIQIDLEYQWRQSLPGRDGQRPRLEDYVRRFPELADSAGLSLQLISTEYRIRQRWGDRPRHDEYAVRFPLREPSLGQVLLRIDADLAVEFAQSGTPLPPVPAPPAATEHPELPRAVISGLALIEGLRQHHLLHHTQLNELLQREGGSRSTDPRDLARELLQRNWLTPYQVNQLLQGRVAELVLGPYLLLQRLGEGGAGKVFKARHQKMERIVALKVLHKELLTDSEAVARFCREIQVLSQLDHPNVVHAYDAGPFGASYFLVMEYVEGTDLARLVKQCGPLPVMQACAYVRQAALGLQYAHERGLVHRDIKPHNLILSLREGRIKVADLGLARFPRAANEEATAALGGSKASDGLTPPGAVAMGTLDYLAPEQALNFHAADIRADIYSLGCTLWYLLIGQPPFAEGTLAEKLLSHQSKEPPAIEKLRADVPAGLSNVLRRMLAKRPEDRYRTPAEVAEAVAPYISSPDGRDLEFDPGGWSFRARAYTTWEMLCKFVRRNKAFSAAVVTAMVLLAWSSVVNYQARRETERANDRLEERTQRAVPALVGAAQMLAERQDLAEALRQVNMALEYNPKYAPAHLVKGQVLIAQMDFATAQAELAYYLEANPNDADTKELLRLSRNIRSGDGARLLQLADVLVRQKAYGPFVCLMQEVSKLRIDRKTSLPVWRKRIEAAWPGLGNALSLNDVTGGLRLELSGQDVRDLSPLKGMPLAQLDLGGCRGVQDLSPLMGMPLTGINLNSCSGVQDLSPLKDMPLTWLNLYACSGVRDLSPLKDMLLTWLDLGGCSGVRDLSLLKGMPLTALFLRDCKEVEDLSPLKGMRLTSLVLRDCTRVHDLSPLKGMPLTVLDILHCGKVHDLSPLKGMRLTSFDFRGCTEVADLSPLKGMPLTVLDLSLFSKIQDLSPLKGMALITLNLSGCRGVRDLSPLEGIKLTEIVLPSQVAKGMPVLRGLKSITKINNVPADEFWKKYDAGEFKQYR